MHTIKNFLQKHRAFALLLVIEAVLLLGHFALSMRVQAPIVLSGSELNALSPEAVVSDGAITVQDSEIYGPFAETPLLNLKKGSYTASVTYSSSLEGAKVFQDNDYIVMNQQELEASDTYASFSLWAKGNTATSFKFSYNGGTRTISQFTLTPTHAYARVSSIGLFLLFALLDCFLLLRMKALPICRCETKQKLIYAGLAALILFLCLPLFSGFLFVGYDLHFHLSRIEGIAAGLASGQFPVKIYPNLLQGQGYANGVFYGDLLLYIPAILRLVGFSLQSSYRIYIALVNIATVLVSYWCFTKMFGSRLIGLLGSALYSLSLYRYMCIYNRAAVGEYSAMIFLPLIFYSLWGIFSLSIDSSSYKKLWIPGVIGYSGLIQTHILTCGMAAIFTILACLIFIRRVFRRESFLVLVKIVLYTALANLWFLIPFADYTLGGSFRLAASGHDIWNSLANSAEPLQVFDLFVRSTGGSSMLWDGIQDDACISVGAALLLGSLILPLLWLDPKFKSYTAPANGVGKVGFVFGLLALAMATTLFPWYSICTLISPIKSFISTMQFTWRFLSLAGLFLAVCCSAGLYLLQRKNKQVFYIAVSIVGCFALFTSAYFCHDLYQNKYSDVYYDFSDVMTHTDHTPFQKQLVQLSGAEYLPAESDLDEVWLLNTPTYDADSLTITDYVKSGLRISFHAENHTSQPQDLTVPFLSYNGYRAYAAGQELNISRSAKGQVQLALPANFSGLVTVFFQEPVLWRISEGISLFCLLAFAVVQFYSKFCHMLNKRAEVSVL